jgi:hypothetical protein
MDWTQDEATTELARRASCGPSVSSPMKNVDQTARKGLPAVLIVEIAGADRKLCVVEKRPKAASHASRR